MTQDRWSAGMSPEPGQRLVHPGHALGRQRPGRALQPAQRRGRRRGGGHRITLPPRAVAAVPTGQDGARDRAPRPRGRPAPHRLPDGAPARGDLPGAGVPAGRRRAAPRSRSTRCSGGCSSARCASCPASARRPRRWSPQSLAGELPDYLRAACEAQRGRGGARPTADAGRRGAAARAARRLPHPLDWSDGGSPIREMALAARDLGHEYMVLTDHSPRLDRRQRADRRPAAGPAGRGRAAQRGAGAVPDPHRHRGRHPRGRRARPGGRAAGPARPRGGQRALEAADAAGADDRADAGRGRATRTRTCSGTAPAGW